MTALQSQARLRMLQGPGRLYAAHSRYCDWIKLGFTSKPVPERLEGIDRQYAHFAPFSLIGSVPSLWAAEQQLHSWLAPFRRRNKAQTTELYPACASVSGVIKRVLANDEWTGLEYPESREVREWCRRVADHPLNRVEADVCFERFFAEQKLASVEASFLSRRADV